MIFFVMAFGSGVCCFWLDAADERSDGLQSSSFEYDDRSRRLPVPERPSSPRPRCCRRRARSSLSRTFRWLLCLPDDPPDAFFPLNFPLEGRYLYFFASPNVHLDGFFFAGVTDDVDADADRDTSSSIEELEVGDDDDDDDDVDNDDDDVDVDDDNGDGDAPPSTPFRAMTRAGTTSRSLCATWARQSVAARPSNSHRMISSYNDK